MRVMREKIEKVYNTANELIETYNSIDLDIRRLLGTSLAATFSFLFLAAKLIIGIATHSVIFLYSCVYALLMLLCKLIFLKGLYKSEKEKYKSYNLMALVLFLGAFAFNMSLLIRLNAVREEQRFHPIFAIIFSFYLIFLYVLSIYGLWDAKRQNDLLFLGLKLVTYSSFFMNMVLAQRLVIGCLSISDRQITFINFAFGISCGIAMAIIAISMFIYGRFRNRTNC